jgi:hypothetical protein
MNTRFAFACIVAILAMSVARADESIPSRSVAAGSTWTVAQTTRLNALSIATGAALAAPAGKSLTLTVGGVETDIGPGAFKGNVVLTVADQYPVSFAGMGGAAGRVHQFRQAIYLDQSGLVAGKSVTAAAGHYVLNRGVLNGVTIKSAGANFNGIVVAGGTYTLKGARIDFTGNGGNDFAGFGAAILAVGKDATLIVDGATVRTRGVIRTAAVADKSSNLIVKNSDFQVRDGILPAGYRSNVTPGDMWDVPWMLGLSGNARATNLLGEGTTATYINSSISSEGWGVLSVDNGQHTKLTAINSKVSNTGSSGYGSYAIGNSLNAFYGTDFRVSDYAQIVTGGDVIFAASSPTIVAKLNSELKLGLSAAELRALPRRQTTVRSNRFGVMWHGDGAVTVTDASFLNTAKTTFLVKGAVAKINVDGKDGAQLRPGNGVLVQVMDNDDPGPGNENGLMVNNGVYREPTTAPIRTASFDLAASHESDDVVTFGNISLKGDLYNGVRGGSRSGEAMGSAPPGAGSGGPAGPGGPVGPGGPPRSNAGGTNLIVNLESASLAGTIDYPARQGHHCGC